MKSLAQAPAQEFPLVYLYGPHESGRTHLLQAIGNYVLGNYPELMVRYATLPQFLSEFERATEIKKVEEFTNYYKEADIFLIDDFQEFPKKKKDQKIFLEILESMVKNKKQVVIVSDRIIEKTPNLAKTTTDKILSKFGIIINLHESAQEDNWSHYLLLVFLLFVSFF